MTDAADALEEIAIMDNYEKFKDEVLKLTKIDLSAYKEKQMRRRIDSLVEKRECKSYAEYVKLLSSKRDVFDEFVNFLTINVSEFYRNPDQWKLLTEEYVPELIDRFGKKLKIWSAACSTGDEPYSLVMALSKLIDINQIKPMPRQVCIRKRVSQACRMSTKRSSSPRSDSPIRFPTRSRAVWNSASTICSLTSIRRIII